MTRYFHILFLFGPKWFFLRFLQMMGARIGWWRLRTPRRKWSGNSLKISGTFQATSPELTEIVPGTLEQAKQVLEGKFQYFSHRILKRGFPPNWFENPFAPEKTEQGMYQDQHWSLIPDFGIGDIKGIWELGRFTWIYPLLKAYEITEEDKYANAFWDLLEDWMEKNPPNTGVHWKCGQEISIRLFALVSGYFAFAEFSGTTQKRKGFITEIIYESGRRIEANIGYALRQRNNHGLTEAAGLFTAGVMLGVERWIRKGKKQIELQTMELVYDDGSFSQQSTNYHRVMVHVLIWVIQLGRANGIEFPSAIIERLRLAGKWQFGLYDQKSGRMPNLGANDGSLVLQYSASPYYDYRPSIQAVGAVVDGRRWLPAGEWDDLAKWLVYDLEDEQTSETTVESSDLSASSCVTTLKTEDGNIFSSSMLTNYTSGGYYVFSWDGGKLIYRCPKVFKHRPSQCDLLHVDLWNNGINLLRDAGTYSYNCDPLWQEYFSSARAHNTIQFDDHEQMPKLSRFIYGNWPELFIETTKSPFSVYASFTNYQGCQHSRQVTQVNSGFRVTDTISGFRRQAVLRWRLAPELDWQVTNEGCTSSAMKMRISVPTKLRSIKIVEGWESQYYLNKSPLPVLEAEIGPEVGEIFSEIILCDTV